MRSTPKPACATCGLPVKRHVNRYCSKACIPRQLRVDNCRRWRKAYAARRRVLLLKLYLDQVSGRVVTRQMLSDLLWEFGQTRYNAGFLVGRRGRERGEDWRRTLAEAQARGVA